MSILIHLGHPAHYHLFKNVTSDLVKNGYEVHILIKEKDILRSLLVESGLQFENILPEGKSTGKIGMVADLLKRGKRIIRYCRKVRPDLLVGTSSDISYVGKLLGIPSINVNEDDVNVVPYYAWLAYPMASAILSPIGCNNGRWTFKTTTYAGYHELAYLHPDHFIADKEVVSKYVNPNDKFFIIRFASLNAHHDEGIRGIGNKTARSLIDQLKPYGNIIITSERELGSEFESYRLPVYPLDMHHLMAYASAVIGDSQTMSAEAGVLGTPFIRFNDFVGKIGYLDELENKYKLGFGITPDHPEHLLEKALEIARGDKKIFQERRKLMLSEKINTADFLYEFITGFLKKQTISPEQRDSNGMKFPSS